MKKTKKKINEEEVESLEQENFSLTKLLDDDLIKSREEEDSKVPSKFWKASELGLCMRKAIFRRLGVKGAPLTARELKTMKAGELFHKFMQELTKKTGISVEQEMFLEDEELEYRGKIDDIVKLGNTLYVFEYKSEHSKSFDWRKKSEEKISKHHIIQGMSYLHFLIKKYKGKTNYGDIKKVRWIYISKDDMRMDELEIEYTKEWGEFIENILKSLSDSLKKKKLPKPIDFIRDKEFGWQCAGLERYGLYKGKYKPRCQYFKYCREIVGDYDTSILTPQINDNEQND